jgi:hypothetical protein
MKREQRTYRNLKPVAEAREIFLSRFADIPWRLEVVSMCQALGRYMASALYTVRSVPAYLIAAVDGVAVVAATTFPALPKSPVLLAAGCDAIPVNKGDPLPSGTDAVAMVEKIAEAGDHFENREPVYPRQNVRKAGEDIVGGEILPARHLVRPFDQGTLLAAGIDFEVFCRPGVLIIPTGNEIVRPEDARDPLRPGAILEVNGQMPASMNVECGGGRRYVASPKCSCRATPTKSRSFPPAQSVAQGPFSAASAPAATSSSTSRGAPAAASKPPLHSQDGGTYRLSIREHDPRFLNLKPAEPHRRRFIYGP